MASAERVAAAMAGEAPGTATEATLDAAAKPH